MVQLTITHADGSTETIDQTVGWTRTRELGAMRRVTIDVERSLADAVTLEQKHDKIALGSIDTVRLVDVETGGPTWTLICYSMEWDANREEFTPGGDLREGTDDTLVTGLIGEVSSWTAGTVENHTGPLSFVLNHAHRHEALRRIERNVPGEIQFRDEGTVDYLEDLGSDKTASVTLSSANQNIEDEIQITNRGRELDGTHIRVLGAHEGEAQIFANLVPSDDSATYENRVDYTTSRWSDGDARDWDRWENKDVADDATIQEEAAALGEEITESLVEAKATVSGVDLSVGDWVHVIKSDANLDRDMRVHRIKDMVEGAKEVAEVLLSTRTTVRKGDAQELEDIQRFNTAFQGSSVSVQGGGSRQPVDSGVNAEIPFDYPDLAYENDATLQVRGLPYRAYSSGAAAGGTNDDTTASSTPDSDNATMDFDRTTSSGALLQLTVPNVSGDGTIVIAYANMQNTSTSSYSIDLDIDNINSGTSLYAGSSETYDPNDSRFFEAVETGSNLEGDTIEFSYSKSLGEESLLSAGVMVLSDHTHTFDWQHVHDPNPGVIEFGTDTPSGVDVIVNGTTVATDIGSGTFETEVDISGELNSGQWNLIELASDTLGHIQGTVSIDGYKKIGTQ